MKTAFHIPSGVNEDFMRNLMAGPLTTASKDINQQQQNMKQFTLECVSKYTQEKTCAEVSF